MIRKNNDPVPIKDTLGKLTIEELNIKGKRVFIRADFNVPLDNNLSITDDPQDPFYTADDRLCNR